MFYARESPTKYKLLTFAVSSFLTGVAGSFYAHYIGLLTPSLSNISLMIMILAMAYVGGITRASPRRIYFKLSRLKV